MLKDHVSPSPVTSRRIARKRRPSGSICASTKLCSGAGEPATIFDDAPPSDDTLQTSGPDVYTTSPRSPQLPCEKFVATSLRVVTDLVVKSMRRRRFGVKKAIDWLSGDQKGKVASSVSGSAIAASVSRLRSQRTPRPLGPVTTNAIL